MVMSNPHKVFCLKCSSTYIDTGCDVSPVGTCPDCKKKELEKE